MKKTGVFLFAFFVLAGAVLAASKTEAKWMKNGQEMYAAKDYAGAAEAFEKVLAENPKNTGALTYAGYSYMYAGDKQAAIEKLEAAYAKTGDEKIAGYLDKLKGKNPAVMGKDKDEVKGGAARVAALGGAGIALPDISNMTDLYSMGFTSSYASRKGGSIIYMSPMLALSSFKTKETDDDTFTRNSAGFASNMYGQNEQGIALRLINNNSIILKPRIVAMGGEETTDTGAIALRDISASLLGGDIEIAHKFGALSIGGVFGYDTTATQTVDPGQPLDKTTVDMSKLSYFGSVSYVLDFSGPELSIAFSGGSRTRADAAVPFEIRDFDYGFDDEYALLAGRYNSKTVISDQWIFIIVPMNTITTTETVMTGMDYNLGLEFKAPGILEMSLSGGISPGISGTTGGNAQTTNLDTGNITSGIPPWTVDPYSFQTYTDGMKLSGALKARGYVSDLLVAGVAVDFMNISVTRIPIVAAFLDPASTTTGDPVAEILTVADVSGGIAVKLGGSLNIPIEGFYQTGTRNEKDDVAAVDQTWSTNVMGFRTGVEFMITEELAARIGVEYATGGASYKVVDSGTVTVDEPYGTADNPGKYKIVLGPGLGYRTGGFDINLAGRYIFSEEVTGNSVQEVETGYATKSSSDIEILASVLVAF